VLSLATLLSASGSSRCGGCATRWPRSSGTS